MQPLSLESQHHLAVMGVDGPGLQWLSAVEGEAHAVHLEQRAVEPEAVLGETGLVHAAGQVHAHPQPIGQAGQAGPVPVGFRTHVTGGPVVMGEGADLCEIEFPQGAAHLAATGDAGDLLRIDPAIGGRRRADAHRLEGRLPFAEAGIDAGAVIQLHQQPLLLRLGAILQTQQVAPLA
ncbi:hypothetical protein D9M68_762990 [compost metagenome]